MSIIDINNVGSIAQALFAKGNPNYDEAESTTWQAAQVSAISIMNFSGRLLIGPIADLTKSRLHYPRSFCCILVVALFVLSQIVIINVDDVHNLWKASLLLGSAYGSLFGLLPSVTIEWFGLSEGFPQCSTTLSIDLLTFDSGHFSENWGYISLAPVIGGNLFSLAFGRNLDAHDVSDSTESSSDVLALSSTLEASTAAATDAVRRAGLPEQAHQCYEGKECYVSSLYLTLGATIIALGLACWAAWRDRKDRRAIAQSQEEVLWETIPEEEEDETR